jgi:hypothetical protein
MMRKRLVRLNKAKGNLDHLIPKLVNEAGQAHAAQVLDVSPSTISRWLRKNNYRPEIIWRKTN